MTEPIDPRPPARPMIGEIAPDFRAQTTQGVLRLHTWEPNKWVVLFAHPADFTPVCTSEILALAKAQEAFAERDVALLGLSIDSIYSHIAWVRELEQRLGAQIEFPLIADADQSIAMAYGMLDAASAQPHTVRTVFFLDVERTIRASLFYPVEIGRSVTEILRIVDALQAADRHRAKAPSDWQLGRPMLQEAPSTVSGARQHQAETPWYYVPLSPLEPE